MKKKKQCTKGLAKKEKRGVERKEKKQLKPNSQKVKKKRGRKLSEPIIGFTSQRSEVLKMIILLYEQGAMNQHFNTGMANLARYIARTELLKYCVGEEHTSLKLSSITVMLSNTWTDIKEEREIEEKKQRIATEISLMR
ncbi:hypothetical protein [Bacteroides neonati]|uniref:hypothetical protein n=1 Tax=Bacteroides neonati TaxID=1347393 RepID=UPI0004BA67A0|nr:hypothetical protein [Bacteroides neonati]